MIDNLNNQLEKEQQTTFPSQKDYVLLPQQNPEWIEYPVEFPKQQKKINQDECIWKPVEMKYGKDNLLKW